MNLTLTGCLFPWETNHFTMPVKIPNFAVYGVFPVTGWMSWDSQMLLVVAALMGPSTSCTSICFTITMLQYYIYLDIVLTVILVLGLGFGIILYFVIGTWSNGPDGWWKTGCIDWCARAEVQDCIESCDVWRATQVCNTINASYSGNPQIFRRDIGFRKNKVEKILTNDFRRPAKILTYTVFSNMCVALHEIQA